MRGDCTATYNCTYNGNVTPATLQQVRPRSCRYMYTHVVRSRVEMGFAPINGAGNTLRCGVAVFCAPSLHCPSFWPLWDRVRPSLHHTRGLFLRSLPRTSAFPTEKIRRRCRQQWETWDLLSPPLDLLHKPAVIFRRDALTKMLLLNKTHPGHEFTRSFDGQPTNTTRQELHLVKMSDFKICQRSVLS